MSTYTDLHNRIKENLTILRKPGSKDDGMSPQKVILINPENQFYGSFNGQMNITGGTLSDLNIVGGILSGTTIKDAYFLDGSTKIPIGDLANSVSDHEQRVTQLEADAKTISAAHDSLSTDLSTAIDNLSSSVDKKLDSAVDEIKKSIGGVVGDVAILSDDLGELSTKVETLSTSMLNGVVYKGELKLQQTEYDKPSDLLERSNCCIAPKSKHPNGWMWRIKLDKSKIDKTPGELGDDYVKVYDYDPETDTTLTNYMLLGNGDYVILKNHDPEEFMVDLNKMILSDLDLINAQDEDDSKIQELRMISSLLDTKIDILSDNLSDEIEKLSNALSGEIDSLSTRLSNDINKLSSNLCAEIDTDRRTIKEVSAETLRQAKSYTDEEITSLSGTTSSLIQTVSAETLRQAKNYTESYANGISSELCGAVNNRLAKLGNDLSTYSNQLCTELSNQVDAEFVHNAGDEIASLSVKGILDVVGKTTISNEVVIDDDFNDTTGTRVEIAAEGIVAKTHAGLKVESDEEIEIKSGNQIKVETTAPVDVSGSRFRGTFTNGFELESDGGLATLSVNGKTIQSTLDDLTSEVNTTVNARLVALSGNLSSYSNGLCGLISTEVNNSYVHKSGDEIAWAEITDLTADAANFKKLSVETTEDVKIASSKNIILSSTGVKTNVGLDKVVIAGTSLQKTISDVSSYLETKKLDVTLANTLSSKLSNDVDNAGFLKAISVDLDYDKHDKKIILKAGDSKYEIETDDFVKDGMLKDARYESNPSPDGKYIKPPYIVLTFNTDADDKEIWIEVGDLVDEYTASEDGITVKDNEFSLKYDDIKEKTGLNELSVDLYGKSGDPATIGRLEDLQNQIDAISVDEFGSLIFAGHLAPDVDSGAYSSLSALFYPGTDDPAYPGCVKNGGVYNVTFHDPSTSDKSVSVELDGGEYALIGNGDILVIHNHDAKQRFVALSDLTYADHEGKGNVYHVKAGIQRFEFEAEVKQRKDDDAFISSWILSNFANTGVNTYDLTTTLKQDVSASNDLSVKNDAYILNDLSVAGSLFVNGAQLGITIKEEPTTGEEKTVAETTADEIKFTAIESSGAKSAITLNTTYITMQDAAVDIEATSSFAVSADGEQVISATSSQIDFFSVMTVSSDQATITTLSAGILSADTLTARNAEVTERFDATSAYIDYLSVSTNLSVPSFNKLIAVDTLSTVEDICVDLSTAIKDLSDDLSDAISSLSVSLSTQISGLTENIYNELGTLDSNTHLTSLQAGSDLGDVIDAVVAIRDTLSSLRETLGALLPPKATS